MIDGTIDRSRPDEAGVKPAGLSRFRGDRLRLRARPVDVPLPVADAQTVAAIVDLQDFGADNGCVEGTGAVHVGDTKDDVVEFEVHGSR